MSTSSQPAQSNSDPTYNSCMSQLTDTSDENSSETELFYDALCDYEGDEDEISQSLLLNMEKLHIDSRNEEDASSSSGCSVDEFQTDDAEEDYQATEQKSSCPGCIGCHIDDDDEFQFSHYPEPEESLIDIQLDGEFVSEMIKVDDMIWFT